MQEKIQKVVNEIAKIFDVHMIALTVRKPHNKEAMLAMYVVLSAILMLSYQSLSF